MSHTPLWASGISPMGKLWCMKHTPWSDTPGAWNLRYFYSNPRVLQLRQSSPANHTGVGSWNHSRAHWRDMSGPPWGCCTTSRRPLEALSSLTDPWNWNLWRIFCSIKVKAIYDFIKNIVWLTVCSFQKENTTVRILFYYIISHWIYISIYLYI